MSVRLEGGCEKCNSFMFKIIDTSIPCSESKLICDNCYEKYYSPQSIRNKKLSKLIKKWWEFWK